ncbi:hypothetical protein IAT38_004367 [Cryptococcus sp. DSM 104549]
MSARSSIRVSIAWSGAPPIEDTDTLVLTIGAYSLDLRVFVSGPDAGKIDWSTVAFVGDIEGSTPENPQLRWDHIIDSRPPSSLPDQGVFDTLPSGDVSETGVMFNPKTGENEPYVEIWRRLKQVGEVPFCVLQGELPEGQGKEGEEEAVFVGRVGVHALGLGKVGGKYFAWRDVLEDGAWKRVYEFGDKASLRELLPALPFENPSDWTVGAQVALEDGSKGSWTVKELGKL